MPQPIAQFFQNLVIREVVNKTPPNDLCANCLYVPKISARNFNF